MRRDNGSRGRVERGGRKSKSALLCLLSGLLLAQPSEASPPRVSASARAEGVDTSDMVPGPSTKEIDKDKAPFIMQLLFVDGPLPVSDQAAGLRCTGFVVTSAQWVSVLTAAHCLAVSGFSLAAGSRKLPRAVVLKAGETTLDIALTPQHLTFDASLVARFSGSPPTFVWDVQKDREANLATLFFPGAVSGCKEWPVDVVRIDLPTATVAQKWPKLPFPRARSIAPFAAVLGQSLRVLAGGCSVADPIDCAKKATLYRRFDDASFSVKQRLDCGRLVARSSNTALVMPGDSGGPILASSTGEAFDRLVGVVSGQGDGGSLIIAPVPSTLYPSTKQGPLGGGAQQ